MEKELFMKGKPKKSVVIQADDLKFDGENIIIPSYYDSVIYDYLTHVDTKDMNDADKHDYLAFCSFLESIIDYKADKKVNN